MTVYRWDTRRDIDQARRNLRKFMSNFEGGIPSEIHIELGTFSPRTDIYETSDAYHVVAELPGLSENDVKITLKDGVLAMKGEKKRPESSGEHHFRRIERSHGEFEREFRLPEGLNLDTISAEFKQGLLHITIAKATPEAPREREVKITVGAE